MSYVDGYVIPLPKKNLKAYQKLAKASGKIWKKHGALDYKECIGEDLKAKGMTPFTKAIKTKTGEMVVFAYIEFRSRKHRDEVNKKVMQDPQIQRMCKTMEMPFNPKRMAYGGFRVIVDA